MSLNLECPECETPIRVAEEKLGKKVRCKHCDTVFVARDEEDELPRKSSKSAASSTKTNGKTANRIDDEDDDSRPRKSRRPAEDDDEEAPRPRRRKKQKPAPSNRGLWIGLGSALGAIAIGVILFLVLGGKSKKSDTSTAAEPEKAVAQKTNPTPIPNPTPNPTANPNPMGITSPNTGMPPKDATQPPMDMRPKMADPVALPPADGNQFTIGNARLGASSRGVGGGGPASKGMNGSGKSLFVEFRKNQAMKGIPSMMFIIETETGDKISLYIPIQGGPALSFARDSGAVELVISDGSGGGPFNKGRALPDFGKKSKIYIAGQGGRTSPLGPPSEGGRLSNTADLKVD